jgi:hypothetical protein
MIYSMAVRFMLSMNRFRLHAQKRYNDIPSICNYYFDHYEIPLSQQNLASAHSFLTVTAFLEKHNVLTAYQ